VDIKEQDVPDDLKKSFKELGGYVGISTETMWQVVLNTRALALAEVNLKAAHLVVNEALTSAAAAYAQSSLWNAWKQASPQLLKQN